jgi:hypothetical protein
MARQLEPRTGRLSSGRAKFLTGLALAALLLVGYLVWSHTRTHPSFGPDWVLLCRNQAAKAEGPNAQTPAYQAAYEACLTQHGAFGAP